jgi:hypothetical protein
MHALTPSPEAFEACKKSIEECLNAPTGFFHIPIWSEIVLFVGVGGGTYMYRELKKRAYGKGHGSIRKYIGDGLHRRDNDSDYSSGYGNVGTPFD